MERGIKIRAFIAVNLDRQIQNELMQIQRELKDKIKEMRWIKGELLHVTIKFLGEVEINSVTAITEKLQQVGDNISPFTLSFSGAGAFPALSRPKVVWVGVAEGKDPLADLARKVDRALTELNPKWYDQNFNFIPHVTIGRSIKNRKDSLTANDLSETLCCISTMKVTSFYLMESILFPSGAIYKPIKKILLK